MRRLLIALSAILLSSSSYAQLQTQYAGCQPLRCGATKAVSYNWQSSFYGYTGNVTSATASAGANVISSGDLLIAIVVTGENGTDPGAITPPAGWTLVSPATFNADGSRVGVYTRIANYGEPGSYTFSWTTAVPGASWVLLDYTGASYAAPLDGTPGDNQYSGSYVSNFDAPSVTPTKSDDMLFCIWVYGASTSTTLPADMTSRVNLSGLYSYNQPWIGVADKQLSSSAATPIETATYGSTGSAYEALSILLQH